MKRIAVILAVFLTASCISACSQAEKEAINNAETTSITSTATPSQAEKISTDTDAIDSNATETESTENASVSDVRVPSSEYPTTAQKAGVGQTLGKQGGVTQDVGDTPKNGANSGGGLDKSSPKHRESTAQNNEHTPDEKPQSKPTSKPTEAPKPKPMEPPAEKKEIDYGQVVSNLMVYGQQLGMVYNGLLGIGNAGWFPPTDISGYFDTYTATSACYGDVEYVIYYYAGLGAEPSDIMFNVIASGGQIYVVYA